MVHLEDIYSLTEFQRHTKEHIERLKQTGRPEVLTINGSASATNTRCRIMHELPHPARGTAVLT
jgi:hypothetical protein